MLNSNAAALSAEQSLFKLRLKSRSLNSAGLVFAMIALASLACRLLEAPQRTFYGFLGALTCIAAGELLVRRHRVLWAGSTLIAGGYALAYFFLYASFYIAGMSSLSSPYPCWFLSMALMELSRAHGWRNSTARWLSLPLTLWASGHTLFHALTSTDVITLGSLSVSLSACASVVGLLWWASLSAAYKTMEQELSLSDQTNTGSRQLYSAAHEAFFLLAALNALALPWYCSTPAKAPLWWALEMPILLTTCWQSRCFFKHGLIMAIWSVSAALLLVALPVDLSLVSRLAVPVSGLAMGLAYRLIPCSRKHWQTRLGFCYYTYAAVLVAMAVPFLQLPSIWEALLYLLIEAALLCVMAIALSDRLLQYVACLSVVAALGLFGQQWQHWTWLPVSMVVAGAYALSFLYGHIKKLGGWPKSDFCPARGSHTLSPTEAGYLEIIAMVIGFLTYLAGTYLLLADPINTITWTAAAILLTTLGFAVHRSVHRVFGLIGICSAAAKMVILDTAWVSAGPRTVISCFAIGLCCSLIGHFYWREFVNVRGRNLEGQPDHQQPKV